jgi:hypothetical protein
MGGILGGIFYSTIQLHILAIAGGILLLGILYDGIKLKIILQNRKHVDENKM